jgi:hypothetical protein
MPNFVEKGHAKNVANLGTLITFTTGFGTGYNPSKTSISLAALNTLKEESQKNLVVVNTHYTNWSIAVEAQQSLFAKLNARLTRVINAAATGDVPPAVLSNAKALNKKLQGVKSRKAADPVNPDGTAVAEEITKTNSTSRMSQDSRLENLEKLVQLLSEQPGYAPNEPDLQVSALQNLLADFKIKNEAVKNAQMLLSNARIGRNKTFYNTETGLVKVAADVKKYVKSVYGATSPEFKQVSGLSFSIPIK